MQESNRGFLLTVLGVVVVVIGLITAFIITGTKKEAEVNAPIAISGERFEINETTVTLGNPDAPTTVTIYEDFGCPYCRDFEEDHRGLLKDYIQGDEVKVEYNIVSILDPNYPDKYPTRAANFMMSVAHHSPEKWHELQNKLYDDFPQDTVEDSHFVELAEQAGVENLDTITSDIENETYVEQVSTNTQIALDSGLEGVPTVQVNGQVVDTTEEGSLENAVNAA